MENVLRGVTSAAGAGYQFEFREGYPAVVNDSLCTKRILDSAGKLFAHGSIQQLEKPIMAAEDFAFYQQEYPGAFFFLGSGSGRADSRWSCDHPRYIVDEEALRTGVSLMAVSILLQNASVLCHQAMWTALDRFLLLQFLNLAQNKSI